MELIIYTLEKAPVMNDWRQFDAWSRGYSPPATYSNLLAAMVAALTAATG